MRNIAILALQGAFAEHSKMFQFLQTETTEIRKLADWHTGIDALVIPGGESTVMLKLLHEMKLMPVIREAITGGMPVMGTCAGAILLAKEVDGRVYDGLSTMDISVRRNAYGRQLGSFQASASVAHAGDNLPLTFIRAPYIDKVYEGAEILATVDGRIVAAQQGSQLALTFHPELTTDTRIHEYFLTL